VRYLSSTIFQPWADAGGTKGLMTSTSGVNADVYPILYVAANAYAIVALKGMFALTPMVVNATPSDSDPMAQRGRVAWKAMQGAVILNDQWMCRCEVAVTA
jgi:N4-gp56 family major capsid protein